MRGEEEWARRCISAALGGVEVRHQDDGSRPGMHDLDIAYTEGPPGGVEITAAADAAEIELWNLLNGRGRWIEPSLVGGWMVELLPRARATRLRAELPAFLRELEGAGIREVRVEEWLPGPFDDAARVLGVTHVFQGGTDSPGSIYPRIHQPLEKSGGFVAPTGDALAEWIGPWVRRPEQAHNLSKLVVSGAAERHLFVLFPGFADAPFAVTDLLMRDPAPLPTVAPDLPAEITHVWAMSFWTSGWGMRWSSDVGWQGFEKVDPSVHLN
jgi:hypothetical protein